MTTWTGVGNKVEEEKKKSDIHRAHHEIASPILNAFDDRLFLRWFFLNLFYAEKKTNSWVDHIQEFYLIVEGIKRKTHASFAIWLFGAHLSFKSPFSHIFFHLLFIRFNFKSQRSVSAKNLISHLIHSLIIFYCY